MKIFALETNIERAVKSFLSEGEQLLLVVRFHAAVFLFAVLRHLLLTLVLVGIATAAVLLSVPLWWAVGGFFLVWIFTVLIKVVTAYIDWKYDFLVVTNDKVVLVNQSSIFHVEVRQMHLENFASVTARTQFWNLFPFGIVCFDLKEGVGQSICLTYIPDAAQVASQITNAVRRFQRAQGGAPPPQAV